MSTICKSYLWCTYNLSKSCLRIYSPSCILHLYVLKKNRHLFSRLLSLKSIVFFLFLFFHSKYRGTHYIMFWLLLCCVLLAQPIWTDFWYCLYWYIHTQQAFIKGTQQNTIILSVVAVHGIHIRVRGVQAYCFMQREENYIIKGGDNNVGWWHSIVTTILWNGCNTYIR